MLFKSSLACSRLSPEPTAWAFGTGHESNTMHSASDEKAFWIGRPALHHRRDAKFGRLSKGLGLGLGRWEQDGDEDEDDEDEEEDEDDEGAEGDAASEGWQPTAHRILENMKLDDNLLELGESGSHDIVMTSWIDDSD